MKYTTNGTTKRYMAEHKKQVDQVSTETGSKFVSALNEAGIL